MTATIFTIFTASTKETTKEVARPKAVAIVNIAAVKTVVREFPWESLGCADSKFS